MSDAKRRFLVRVPWLRALFEAWLISLALFMLLLFTPEEAFENTLSQGALFLVPATSLWAAARARMFSGRRGQRLLKEIAMALLLALLVGITWWLFSHVTQNQTEMQKDFVIVPHLPVTLSTVLCVPGYLGCRAAVALWLGWSRLRQQRLLWALTHIQMQLAFIIAAVGAVVLSAAVTLGSTTSNNVMDRLLYTILPLAGLSTVMIAIILVAVFPPALVLAFLAARRTTNRIESLARAAAQVQQGQYDVQVQVEGQDEIAQLQADFNAMVQDLEHSVYDLHAERDKVSALLQARRDLTASVSHELRTPIATIRGYLDALKREENGAQTEHDLQIIEEEVLRLQRLIDDLFALSRAETGGLDFALEAVDVDDLLRRQAEIMRPVAWRSDRIEIVTDLADNLAPALADPNRLTQVLTNLLRNALRHTSPGGIIALTAHMDGDQILIQVRDTGQGIPPDELEHIWERFYRGRAGRQMDHRGAGLGLALVKELTEAMGGSVSVDSELGQGSTFTIRLPRSPFCDKTATNS